MLKVTKNNNNNTPKKGATMMLPSGKTKFYKETKQQGGGMSVPLHGFLIYSQPLGIDARNAQV